NNTGWNDLHQTIAVIPNSTYRVTGWVRTSGNNTAGYFGLRTPGGQVLGERQFGNLGGYTLLSVDVQTEPNTSAVRFGAHAATGGTGRQTDDVSSVRVSQPTRAAWDAREAHLGAHASRRLRRGEAVGAAVGEEHQHAGLQLAEGEHGTDVVEQL